MLPVRTAPGMGIYAGQCNTVSITGLHIAALPERLMSTTADGVHCAVCSGKIGIRDCAMSGMGDDCVNVHGRYFRILGKPGDRTILVRLPPGGLAKTHHTIPSGAYLDLVSGKTLQTLERVIVVGSEQQGDVLALRLDREPPPSMGVEDLVFDASTRTQPLISNCRFPGNRARGILHTTMR